MSTREDLGRAIRRLWDERVKVRCIQMECPGRGRFDMPYGGVYEYRIGEEVVLRVFDLWASPDESNAWRYHAFVACADDEGGWCKAHLSCKAQEVLGRVDAFVARLAGEDVGLEGLED